MADVENDLGRKVLMVRSTITTPPTRMCTSWCAAPTPQTRAFLSTPTPGARHAVARSRDLNAEARTSLAARCGRAPRARGAPRPADEARRRDRARARFRWLGG